MRGYRLGAIGVLILFFAAVVATVLMPMILFNPKPTGHGNIYVSETKADPIRGRQIYIREGCFYCHSQMTRLQDRGMGPLVAAGDYCEETPHQLGTARTGPDLTNEGGKHPNGWQKAHLINPRALKPGSIMPSFSYLSIEDMRDLVAYIQILGANRPVEKFVQAPEEYAPILAAKKVDTNSDAVANVGKGIYAQNCATCHGLTGRGNGPDALSMETKPANFTRPFYKQYDDAFWYYRISEGVPGTRMPHWGENLTPDQRWYLIAYIKRFPQDHEEVVDSTKQIDRMQMEMEHVQHVWNPPFKEVE